MEAGVIGSVNNGLATLATKDGRHSTVQMGEEAWSSSRAKRTKERSLKVQRRKCSVHTALTFGRKSQGLKKWRMERGKNTGPASVNQ